MSRPIHDRILQPILVFLMETFGKSIDPRFLYIPGDDGPSAESMLTIHGMELFNPKQVEQKSGIAIERDDFSWRKLMMNEVAEVLGPQRTLKADLSEGRVICHCYSKLPLVSAHLASYVFELVHALRQEIIRQNHEMGYYDVDSISLAKTQRYRGRDGASPEFRSTAVSLKVIVRENMLVTRK